MRSKLNLYFAFFVTLLIFVFVGNIFEASPIDSLLVGSAISIASYFASRKLPEGVFNTGLAATLNQTYRGVYSGRLDRNEVRPGRYATFETFKEQTNFPTGILTGDDIRLLKNSSGNSVELPVINYRDVTIGNVRTCAMQSGGPESALVTVTFATFAFGFAMHPASFKNNDIKYQEVFNRNMFAYEEKLAAALEALCVGKLESDKNIYFPAAITGSYYAVAGNALRVPIASQEDFFNQLESIMNTMDYYGQLTDITTPRAMAQVRKIAAQGGGNNINTSFQFGNVDFKATNAITNGAGVNSTHYLIAPNSLALVERLDPDAEMGATVGTHKEWSVERLPIVGLDAALYYQEDCTDASAIQSAGVSHLKRTKVESYEYSLDVALVTPYNSAPASRYGNIVKAEFLNT